MTVESPRFQARRKTPAITPDNHAEIVEGYLDFIKGFAKRYSHTARQAGLETGDLVSIGVIAFMERLSSFDPSQGFELATFMGDRMKGSFIDEMRDHGSMIKIPRSVLTRLSAVNKAERKLFQKLKRQPTYDEIAEEVGCTVNKLTEVYTARTQLVRSLTIERSGEDGDEESTRDLTDVQDFQKNDIRNPFEQGTRRFAVQQAITKLSDTERYVVVQYYYKGKPLATIGKRLGVTESRVCQIHTKALKRIGDILGKDFESD